MEDLSELKVLTVPHSPALELKIIVRKSHGTYYDGYIARTEEYPNICGNSKTIAGAIGELMMRLADEDADIGIRFEAEAQ